MLGAFFLELLAYSLSLMSCSASVRNVYLAAAELSCIGETQQFWRRDSQLICSLEKNILAAAKENCVNTTRLRHLEKTVFRHNSAIASLHALSIQDWKTLEGLDAVGLPLLSIPIPCVVIIRSRR